jgi:hypothetical protein
MHQGLHWATPTSSLLTPTATPSPPPLLTTNTESSTLDAAIGTQSPPPQGPKCDNIVWKLEKCRICLAPQDRCWKCVKLCHACGAVRAPPHINHQTALERERASRLFNGRGHTTTVTATAQGSVAVSTPGRPITPPGSISLSQLSNPALTLPSAYLSLRGAGLTSLTSAMVAATSPSMTHMPVALPVPPEFSFFD